MKVLVLGGGGPAGVNAIRALRAAGHHVVATESNPLHLDWPGVETFHAPVHTTDLLDDIIEKREIEFILPQPDPLVRWMAENRGQYPLLLPPVQTIERCQDKVQALRFWHEAGLREHAPVKLEEPWPDYLHFARDKFGLPFWLRATKGAGAKGAILARSIEEAYHWIRFWQLRDAGIQWVTEEHLPGRDLAWSSVWCKGRLLTSFARERLEYIYPHLTPEGLTGTPVVARVVHDPEVNAVAENAVLAIDAVPHGIYSVDLKENAGGVPCPTEINAGRGFTTFGLWSLHSVNFLDVVVRAGLFGPEWWIARPDLSPPPMFDALPEGLTLSRHIDIPHEFTKAKKVALTRCA